MEGFFSLSEVTSKPTKGTLIPKCGACGLYKKCNSPKMPVSGKGKRGILVVAEAPGKDEDRKGVQLVGESGKLLEKTLRRMGVDMRRDCWLTNSLICRPPNNATPTNDQIDWCRPNLIQTVEALQPAVIVPLGASAVRSLLGWLWKDEGQFGIGRWAGWTIPLQRLNAWICPTYHPSHLLWNRNEKKQGTVIVERMFEDHLMQAVAKAKEGRPWDEVPKFEDQVEIVMDVEKAAKVIHKMIRYGGTVAFDYETNMLKPDNDNGVIVSCSVCWEGQKTIAFPFHGEAVNAVKKLVCSDLKKVAANMKFEERWTRIKLGVKVKNWAWDTMVNAHVLDAREAICSLKFQSFVNFGMEDYNHHIEPYLQANGSYAENRIRQVKLRDLLLYNGLDSLLEFKLAELQRESLNFPSF